MYVYIDDILGTSNDKKESKIFLEQTILPPCHSAETEFDAEVQKCCILFDKIFQRNNIKQIMSLMKYSLDLSNPWIAKYYEAVQNDKAIQKFGTMRDAYKFWLSGTENDMLTLMKKSGVENFINEFG